MISELCSLLKGAIFLGLLGGGLWIGLKIGGIIGSTIGGIVGVIISSQIITHLSCS